MNVEQEMKMFGMTKAQIDHEVADRSGGTVEWLVVSMLSDIQTEIELGLNESARQRLNIAKYILVQHGNANVFWLNDKSKFMSQEVK